jgi:hypothetical protein
MVLFRNTLHSNNTCKITHEGLEIMHIVYTCKLAYEGLEFRHGVVPKHTAQQQHVQNYA